MIIMMDTPTPFATCRSDLGTDEVEQLFTPLTRYNPQEPEARFAIDNGAFSRFSPSYYRACLAKHRPRRDLCRFVTAPDVVGSARRTLEVFQRWKGELAGWPVALVCQDGQEHMDIPWDEIAAVFIGGSTDWKLGPHAVACIKAAQALGKWVHVGRVNTGDRFRYFEDLGVDSIDGSGIARFTDTRQKLGNEIKQQTLEIGA